MSIVQFQAMIGHERALCIGDEEFYYQDQAQELIASKLTSKQRFIAGPHMLWLVWDSLMLISKYVFALAQSDMKCLVPAVVASNGCSS